MIRHVRVHHSANRISIILLRGGFGVDAGRVVSSADVPRVIISTEIAERRVTIETHVALGLLRVIRGY